MNNSFDIGTYQMKHKQNPLRNMNIDDGSYCMNTFGFD